MVSLVPKVQMIKLNSFLLSFGFMVTTTVRWLPGLKRANSEETLFTKEQQKIVLHESLTDQKKLLTEFLAVFDTWIRCGFGISTPTIILTLH